jgi:hypothetical protein
MNKYADTKEQTPLKQTIEPITKLAKTNLNG